MKLDAEVIALIYDVPLGQSKWEDVIEAVRIEMQAEMGLFFLARPNQPPVVITTIRQDESIWQTYEEYYWQLDPWNEILNNPEMPQNLVSNGWSHIDKKSFLNSDYYHGFWKPMGLGETAGGKVITDNGILIQLGFPKYINSPDYTREEINLLKLYCHHIKKAIELEGYLGSSLPNKIYEFGLMSQFGLSHAEAQLVLALVQCDTLKSAASHLNRSYHTARTQLKSIFCKTETSSQLSLFKKLFRR